MQKMHTAFVKELKEKLDEKQLLFTLSLLSHKDYASIAFDYPAIAKYFDFIHIALAGGYEQSFENELKARNVHDSEYVIDELIKLGVPPSKILIDIKFKGFHALSDRNFKEHRNYWGSSEYICFQIILNNYNITYNIEFGVGLAMNMNKNDIYLIESSRVIANKIRFAMRSNLAGVLINGVGSDDYNSRCKEIDNDTYDDYKSLVTGVTLNIPIQTDRKPFYANILNEAIIVALDEIEQETKIMAKNRLINHLMASKKMVMK